MAKKKQIRNVLCFLVMIVLLMSVMPVSVFAVNDSDNTTGVSNSLIVLENAFTEESPSSGDCAPVPDADLPEIYLNGTQECVLSSDSGNDTNIIILTDVSDGTRETVSALGCDVYVKIDDPCCKGYKVYVDGVYQFTEGQDGTPDGYCAFDVCAGTHTIKITKNGRSASKTNYFQCGTTYRWVSMPYCWCEDGDDDDCKYPPTVKFDKTKYYEGDTVHATVSTSQSSVYYKIKDCSGTVRKSGTTSSGKKISYTIPTGASKCCYWQICFYWNEYTPPWMALAGAGGKITALSYDCTKCYKFYVCPKTTCDVYVKIDDPYCVGYKVYVDGVYQFTEGEGETPDGYCAFHVKEGTHTLKITKNGRSASKTINFECNIVYRWVSMPDNWCNPCADPPTAKFDKQKYNEGDSLHATVSTSSGSVNYKIKDCGGNIRKSGDISNGGMISYTIPTGASECCNWQICFYWGEGGSDIGPLGAGGELTAQSYECTKCYKFEVCPREKPAPEIIKVTYPTTCVKEGEDATISVTVENKGGMSSEGYISVSFPNDEEVSVVSGTGNEYNKLYPKGFWSLWNSKGEQMMSVDPLVDLLDTSWVKDQQETITMNVKPNSGSDEIVFYVRAALKNADGTYERDPTYSGDKDQQGWCVERHVIDVCPVSKTGTLTVTLYPSDVQSNARWKLTTETSWHSSGETITNIPVGSSCTIQFKDLSGWTKPSEKTVTINEGSNSQSGTYTQEEAKGDMSLLWKNETADYVLSVSVSENGEYVAVGSRDTYVYYFNKIGDLIWKHKTNGAVNSVSTSNDGNYVIAGSDDYHIYYFDKDGFLWRIKVDERITTTDISSDGRYAIAGSWNKYVYFFDIYDINKPLWKRLLDGYVAEVSISDNGVYIAIGGEGYVYLLDKYNTTIWKKDIGGGYGRVDISGDGNYVIVGGGLNYRTSYCYGRSGKLKWEDPYDEYLDDNHGGYHVHISSVSLSTDGSYGAVGSYGWDITIRSFDKTGNVVWRIKNDAYAVDISGDGHYIAAGVSSAEIGERILYIDNFDDGNIIYEYGLEYPAWEIDLSKDGKYFAAAAKNTVYFFGSPDGNPEPNITAQIYSNGWKPVESFSIYPQAKRDIKFTIENRGWGSNLGYIDISVSKGLDILSWEDDSSGYMSYENLGPNSNNPTGKASYSDGSRRVPQFELLSGYKPFGSGEKNTLTVTVKATGEGEQWIMYRASMKTSDGYVRDPSSGDVDQQGWYAYNITVTVDGTQPDVVIPIEDEYADWISIGDLNDDDLNDIVMENGDVFYQQLDNSFLLDNLGFEGICVCAGKINNDDLNDIVMTSHFSEPPTNYGLIRIYYQQNDNTFNDVPDLKIETGYWAKYCQIDDINNDGLNDILVGLGIIGSTGETSTKIYYQKEDGSFSSTPDVDASWLSGIVSLSDFNQDGLKDLVGESASTWGPVVYFQSPDHTFDSSYDERMTHLPFGVSTLFKGMDDVDGNGLDDIIYNNKGFPDQSVVYCQFTDHNFIASDTQYVTGRDVNSIDVGDLNNDGQNDVAIFYDDHTFKGPGFIGIYYQKYVMDIEILSPTNDFSVLKDSNVPIEVKVTYEGAPITGASLVRASFSNGDPDVILTGGVNGIYTGTWTPTNTIGGQVETPVEITVEASHGTLSKGYAKVKGVIEDGDIIKVEILSPDNDFQVLEGSNVPIKVRLTNKGVPITGAILVRASFSNGDTDVILTGGVNGIYTGSWTPTNTNEGQDETPVEITIEATHATLNEGHANVAGVISNEYMYVGEIRKRLIENPEDIVNNDIKVHAFIYSNVSFRKTAGIFKDLVEAFSIIFPGQIDDLFLKGIDYEGDVLTFYVIAGDRPGETDYVADGYPTSFIVASFPWPIKPGIKAGSIVEINGKVKEGGAVRYYLEPDILIFPPGISDIKYDPPNSLFTRLPKLYDDLEESKRIGEKVSTMGFIDDDWFPTNSGYYFAHFYSDGDDGKRRRIPIAFHKSEMPDTYGLTLINGTIVDDKKHHLNPYILVDSIEIKVKSNRKVPDMVSASTDCPVHLHAYDAQGRHVGMNAAGGIDFEIPDAYHSGIASDGEEIIILNQSEGIRFSVVAIDRGVFNLTIIQSTDRTLKEIFYQNVPISETTVATVDVSQENPTHTMKIDDDGDGKPEKEKHPIIVADLSKSDCNPWDDDGLIEVSEIMDAITLWTNQEPPASGCDLLTVSDIMDLITMWTSQSK